MEQTGAEITVSVLLEQGIDTVFGYPGGQILDLVDALYRRRNQIQTILTAHEQGAAHAADGYARATGKTGVVLATSGPGATNLVTGIATAYLDSTPLVAITGNVARGQIGRDNFQEVDIWGITLPITKHNYIVQDIHDLAAILREAFAIAQTGRPGPVLVDIPKDVQLAYCTYTPELPTVLQPLPVAGDAALQKAAHCLSLAKRPYLYCGGGVVRSNAGAEVVALATQLDAVIGCSVMGLSSIPADAPPMLGMQGVYGRYAASQAMEEADLILALGVRFSDRAAAAQHTEQHSQRIIHIDIDDAEIGKNIPAYLGIIGDVGDTLRRLSALLPEIRHIRWRSRIAALRTQEAAQLGTPPPLSPYPIICAVHDVAPPDSIIVTDVGQHQMHVARHYALNAPRSLLTSGGLGTMGFGLGAAIGAAVATKKRIVLFTGDGGFSMSAPELATAVRLRLPLVIVLLHNGTLGLVRQWQGSGFDKHYYLTDLPQATDFAALAVAYGAMGITITEATQLPTAIAQAFSVETPVLLDCRIGPDDATLTLAQTAAQK